MMNLESGSLSFFTDFDRRSSRSMIRHFLVARQAFWPSFWLVHLKILYMIWHISLTNPQLQAQIFQYFFLKRRKLSICPVHETPTSQIILNSQSPIRPGVHCFECLKNKGIPMTELDRSYQITSRAIKFKFFGSALYTFNTQVQLSKSFNNFMKLMDELNCGLSIEARLQERKNELEKMFQPLRKVQLLDYLSGKTPLRIYPVHTPDLNPQGRDQSGRQGFELIDPREYQLNYLINEANRQIMGHASESIVQKIAEVAFGGDFEPDGPLFNRLPFGTPPRFTNPDGYESPTYEEVTEAEIPQEPLSMFLERNWPKIRKRISKHRHPDKNFKIRSLSKSAVARHFQKIAGSPLRLLTDSAILRRSDLPFLKWQAPRLAKMRVALRLEEEHQLPQLAKLMEDTRRNLILAVKAGDRRFALVYETHRKAEAHLRLPFLVSFDRQLAYSCQSPQENPLAFSFALDRVLTSPRQLPSFGTEPWPKK